MKKSKLFVAFMLTAVIMTGCASSKKNAPVENVTQTVTEENTEQETEIQTEENNEENTNETTTVETAETTTAQVSVSSSGDGTSVNVDIKAKAATGAKQQTSHNTAPKPTETTAPEGARIIATSAAACDIADRLGLSLVGVPETSVSALASRYDGVTTVGSPMSPDMEIIKSLNPTDVITPDTLQNDLEIQYKNIGVNYTFINLRSVKGLYDSVKLIGDKYDKSKEAEAVVKEYEEFMASYSSKHSGQKPKVLVLMGLPGSYLVATQNSYAGSLVELAGGENVFHDDTKDFLTINPEEMLARDPDVIIRTAHGLPKEALEMFEKEFSTNDIWKHFRAVQNNKVYDVDYMLFGMSATFDYPQALADLEPMLFGD
jgi:iron complex transport system substrate-binding protein